MDLLAAFRAFVRVAEAGSFSAVARELGTTQPAVSRQISALETHLGARLIQRTTRSLAITEDGRTLLDHARRVLEAVDETEAAIGRRHDAPSGMVHLATPGVFGRLHVIPRLGRLMQRYPDLSLDLHVSDAVTDLVAEGLDLAIRTGQVTDASLVARKIGSSTRIVAASADYIAAHGEPSHPSDLSRADCIVFSGQVHANDWRFEGPDGALTVRVDSRIRTDAAEGIREAVLCGYGFALVPLWFFGEDLTTGRVQVVLKDWQPSRSAIYAVYPSRRNLARRTRAVIDFLVDEFRLDPVISSYGET